MYTLYGRACDSPVWKGSTSSPPSKSGFFVLLELLVGTLELALDSTLLESVGVGRAAGEGWGTEAEEDDGGCAANVAAVPAGLCSVNKQNVNWMYRWCIYTCTCTCIDTYMYMYNTCQKTFSIQYCLASTNCNKTEQHIRFLESASLTRSVSFCFVPAWSSSERPCWFLEDSDRFRHHHCTADNLLHPAHFPRACSLTKVCLLACKFWRPCSCFILGAASNMQQHVTNHNETKQTGSKPNSTTVRFSIYKMKPNVFGNVFLMSTLYREYNNMWPALGKGTIPRKNSKWSYRYCSKARYVHDTAAQTAPS